jgi:phosphoglycolate phosphatase
MIKALGFDFDGTIIMSEKNKGKEMAAVFRENFSIMTGVKTDYEKLAGYGHSRDKKVEILFKKYLRRKPTIKEKKMVGDHFGEHYQRDLANCPLFQCTNVIKELKKQVKFMFLLSLENRKEVVMIVRRCGIENYFDEILGGPKSKIVNFRHILKKHKLKPSEVIYIGDNHSDVVAGKKMKIKVILLTGTNTFTNLKRDLQADFVFSNLCSLPAKIEQF